MTTTRTLATVVMGLLLLTQALQAHDRSRYRDFQLGGDLSSVSRQKKEVEHTRVSQEKARIANTAAFRP